MLTIRRSVVAACTIAAAGWISVAIAADAASSKTAAGAGAQSALPGQPTGAAPGAGVSTSGAMPGDEALTCDQIYAQGMAESQRDQEERSKRSDQMRAQSRGTAAMMTGAMMAGGLGGTGQMAQAAAERQADSQMAMLNAPQQSNPRMDHLKQLWAQKHCVRK